jgi:hypothetical protein
MAEKGRDNLVNTILNTQRKPKKSSKLPKYEQARKEDLSSISIDIYVDDVVCIENTRSMEITNG